MKDISKRKDDHIKFAIESGHSPVSAGFDRYLVVHNSLPETSFEAVDASTPFMGRNVAAPIMIAALTGGTQGGAEINKRLAKVAGDVGIPICLGSAKIVFKEPETIETFKVRHLCPNAPLIANLGIADLDRSFKIEDCRRLVGELEADALMFHLNPLHEALQGNLSLDFSGVLAKLSRAVKELRDVSVMVKEVGHGISESVFRAIEECGVAAIDISGAGGTDWAEIELLREPDHEKRKTFEAFRGWGTPTIEILEALAGQHLRCELIASGGIRNGVDVFKSVALDAGMTAVGKPFLELAAKSGEALRAGVDKMITEFKLAMFSAGCVSHSDISQVHIKKKHILDYHRNAGG